MLETELNIVREEDETSCFVLFNALLNLKTGRSMVTAMLVKSFRQFQIDSVGADKEESGDVRQSDELREMIRNNNGTTENNGKKEDAENKGNEGSKENDRKGSVGGVVSVVRVPPQQGKDFFSLKSTNNNDDLSVNSNGKNEGVGGDGGGREEGKGENGEEGEEEDEIEGDSAVFDVKNVMKSWRVLQLWSVIHAVELRCIQGHIEEKKKIIKVKRLPGRHASIDGSKETNDKIERDKRKESRDRKARKESKQREDDENGRVFSVKNNKVGDSYVQSSVEDTNIIDDNYKITDGNN